MTHASTLSCYPHRLSTVCSGEGRRVRCQIDGSQRLPMVKQERVSCSFECLLDLEFLNCPPGTSISMASARRWTLGLLGTDGSLRRHEARLQQI